MDLTITDHPGFLREMNRLNVLWSRVRSGLYIIGLKDKIDVIKDRGSGWLREFYGGCLRFRVTLDDAPTTSRFVDFDNVKVRAGSDGSALADGWGTGDVATATDDWNAGDVATGLWNAAQLPMMGREATHNWNAVNPTTTWEAGYDLEHEEDGTGEVTAAEYVW